MARYGGADIEAFARVLEEDIPSGERDWSIDLAYFLAMALISLNRLEREGIDLSYKTRRLIEPNLKIAWRELVFLRRRRLTEEFALKDIPRLVTLSKRTGRIMIHEDHKAGRMGSRDSKAGNGDSSTSKDTIPNWQRRSKIGGRPRFRRRKYKRPISTDAARLRRNAKSESD
jgi:hypothetical protein